MSCDPNTLMQSAREFWGKIPEGMQRAVQTYLLCQIAQGGNVGGLLDIPGKLSWSDQGVLTSLDLSGIRSLSQGLEIAFGSATVTSISAPDMISLGDSANFNGSASLASLSFPKLAHVVGQLLCAALPITDLNLPALIDLTGQINAQSCGSLVSVSLPNLVTAATGIQMNASPLLTSFSAPNWKPTDATEINFNGCSLDQTSVNMIIAQANNNFYGVLASGNGIDVSGGGNAVPSPLALIAKAAINARRAGACVTN